MEFIASELSLNLIGCQYTNFSKKSCLNITFLGFLSLPLIQEGQLPVFSERMCTILVNRFAD